MKTLSWLSLSFFLFTSVPSVMAQTEKTNTIFLMDDEGFTGTLMPLNQNGTLPFEFSESEGNINLKSMFLYNKSGNYFRMGRFDAGRLQKNGVYSFAIGDRTLASGLSSTAMGQYSTASGSYSTAIGYQTTASGSISTAMGYSTKAYGYGSSAMGRHTIASGESSTAMGYYTTASEKYSTAMGEETIANTRAAVALGYYNKVDNDSENSMKTNISTDKILTVGNGTDEVRSNALVLLKNGNLTVAGTFEKSDHRYKTAIEPLTEVLPKLESLQAVSYVNKDGGITMPDGPQLGLIAQELEAVFPELVLTDTDGYKSVAYGRLSAVLLQGMKEQQQQIEQQQQEISELKAELSALESAVTAINERLAQGSTGHPLDKESGVTTKRTPNSKR